MIWHKDKVISSSLMTSYIFLAFELEVWARPTSSGNTLPFMSSPLASSLADSLGGHCETMESVWQKSQGRWAEAEGTAAVHR